MTCKIVNRENRWWNSVCKREQSQCHLATFMLAEIFDKDPPLMFMHKGSYRIPCILLALKYKTKFICKIWFSKWSRYSPPCHHLLCLLPRQSSCSKPPAEVAWCGLVIHDARMHTRWASPTKNRHKNVPSKIHLEILVSLNDKTKLYIVFSHTLHQYIL